MAVGVGVGAAVRVGDEVGGGAVGVGAATVGTGVGGRDTVGPPLTMIPGVVTPGDAGAVGDGVGAVATGVQESSAARIRKRRTLL